MSPEIVAHIAQRYVVSEEAVRELFRALRATEGKLAQFSHPDLGGRGQWMPGMIMLSNTGDAQTKARIAGLCAEVSAIVQGRGTSADEQLAMPMNVGASGACVTLPPGESWWPASFGHPSATGDQNGIRYAFFPDRDRLLVQQGGRVSSYETGGKHITGFAQAQSTASHIRFTTAEGDRLELDAMKCVPVTP